MKISFLHLILRRFAFLCFLSAGLVASLSCLAAAPRCESLFDAVNPLKVRESALPRYEPFTDGAVIDSKKLAAAGFVLEGDRIFTKEEHREVGILKKFQVPRLFQWAESDFQKDIFTNHGISDAWMRTIIEGDSQAAGRGFYVSTQAIDSINYGSVLTAFEVSKPIYVLEFRDTDLKRIFAKSAKITELLATAGVDALTHSNYKPTWFNFINTRHLQKPTRGIQASFLRELLNDHQDFSPLSQFGSILVDEATLNNFINALKIKDRSFPETSVRNLVNRQGTEPEQNLKDIFRSSSESAKIIGLVWLYSRALGQRNPLKLIPGELVQHLKENVSDESSFEAKVAALVWKQLTPEQKKMLPLSPDYLGYASSFVKGVNGQPLTRKEFDLILTRTSPEQVQNLSGIFDSSSYPVENSLLVKHLQNKVLQAHDAAGIRDYIRNLYFLKDEKSIAQLELPKVTSTAEAIKDSIFDIYDIRTLSKVSSQNKKKGLSPLHGLKDVVVQYRRAKARIDVSTIKTTHDFIKAGKELFGLDLQIRDEDAITVDLRLGSVARYNVDNYFLRAETREEVESSVDLELTHWNPKFLPPAQKSIFSDKFYAAQASVIQKPNFETTSEYKNLTRMGISELLAQIISSDTTQNTSGLFGFGRQVTPQSLVTVFASLKPFREGNEQMAVLLYEILSRRAGEKSASLNFVDRNSIVYIPSGLMQMKYRYFGGLMRAWIRQAKTEEDFFLRTQAALYFSYVYFEPFQGDRM